MSVDFGRIGLAVGHAHDATGATGLTVIRGVEGQWHGGVSVLGRATGTRELNTLSPYHLTDRVDAVLLTGGSAYGLDAAAGVMRWLEERGRGFAVPGGVVPIVPAAVIFDLSPLGRFDARPTAEMAYDACERASTDNILEGSVGVGAGATVGKIAGPAACMKSGFGCAVETAADNVHVGAVAVVNALGDVRDAAGHIIAGARAPGGGFLDTARVLARGALPPSGSVPLGEAAGHNTTLGVVAASVPLTRVQLTQLARASGAALFRRISPAGTSFDGDVVFALAPVHGASAAPEGEPATLASIEALALAALERAIERAVRLARGRDGIPGLADGGDAET